MSRSWRGSLGTALICTTPGPRAPSRAARQLGNALIRTVGLRLAIEARRSISTELREEWNVPDLYGGIETSCSPASSPRTGPPGPNCPDLYDG
jgi:hypothetical protein